jgi:hypothetical protein
VLVLVVEVCEVVVYEDPVEGVVRSSARGLFRVTELPELQRVLAVEERESEVEVVASLRVRALGS